RRRPDRRRGDPRVAGRRERPLPRGTGPGGGHRRGPGPSGRGRGGAGLMRGGGGGGGGWWGASALEEEDRIGTAEATQVVRRTARLLRPYRRALLAAVLVLVIYA